MPARSRTPTKVSSPRTKASAAPRKAVAKARAPARSANDKPEVRIFVSYSHRDADARARLETHLAPLKRDNVETWFDGDMNAGDKLDTGIARALRKAHVFVALLSSDYLASNYCWKIEYRRAMNRRSRGTMRVVAVVVRPCDWKATTAAGFKLLPEDGREVTKWRSADDAYLNVVQGIRRVVAAVRKDMTLAEARPVAKERPAARKKVPGKPAAKRSVARKSAKPAKRTKAARGTRKAGKGR